MVQELNPLVPAPNSDGLITNSIAFSIQKSQKVNLEANVQF